MAEVTRIFHTKNDEETVVIVVRHFTLSDSFEITVNGILVKSFEEPNGRRWFGHKRKRYVLTYKLASSAFWMVSRAMGTYLYELEVDGGKIKENNECLASSPVQGTPTTHLGLSEYIIQGDGACWYLIKWPELNVHVHRRYRDFWLLYTQVCSAYRGTHLYDSVPQPPPKELVPSTNKSPAFLETRMRQLEVFLKRLNGFPGVIGGMNPDVQEFLGISCAHSNIFETSMVFPAGRLGIKLKKPIPATPTEASTFSAQVEEVVNQDLDPNRIRAGDMLTRVGGESALLIGYENAIALLQDEKLRPVVVHLLGIR